MKQLLQSLGLSTLKFLAALAVSSVVAYQGVEAWVESKINDAMTQIKTIREGDILLIDSRLKHIEQDTKIIKEHLLRTKK